MIQYMQPALLIFKETLRLAGLSATKPRILVFTVLNSSGPLTMAELSAACAGEIDRVSVYRAIALFERLAVAQKIYSGWKYKIELGDSFQAHHHHMSCSACGLVATLAEDQLLENQLLRLTQQQGFKTVSHQIEVTGLCKGCR